jgi:hypothetical protein
MGPDREELFPLEEVCPVVEQVHCYVVKMLAVATDKLNFWKCKFSV